MKCNNVKCGKEHDGTFGSGRFCSLSCSKSRTRSTETKNKISASIKKAYDEGRAKAPVITADKVNEVMLKKKAKWNTKLLEADFSSLSHERIRKRVIIEQDGKCNSCGLNTWMDQPIMLELEHKDGNHHHNVRTNVECLCPNCHSLTPTWRGRNKEKKADRKETISEEQMVRAYLDTGNIRQCLLKLGLAAKGANYGRVKRALTIWEVEYNE